MNFFFCIPFRLFDWLFLKFFFFLVILWYLELTFWKIQGDLLNFFFWIPCCLFDLEFFLIFFWFFFFFDFFWLWLFLKKNFFFYLFFDIWSRLFEKYRGTYWIFFLHTMLPFWLRIFLTFFLISGADFLNDTGGAIEFFFFFWYGRHFWDFTLFLVYIYNCYLWYRFNQIC